MSNKILLIGYSCLVLGIGCISSEGEFRWKKAEDDLLRVLVEGGSSWKDIAECFSKRSAQACQERWQSYIASKARYTKCTKATGKGAPWTPQENALLMIHIQQFAPQLPIGDRAKLRSDQWEKIAGYFPERSRETCREHYFSSLAPNGQNLNFSSGAPWTPQEDALLMALVEQFGSSDRWADIAEYFPGRNWRACQNRYFNSLVPTAQRTKTIRKGKGKGTLWSKEEDALLITYIRQFASQLLTGGRLSPGMWKKIAEGISERSARACQGRWWQCLAPNNRWRTVVLAAQPDAQAAVQPLPQQPPNPRVVWRAPSPRQQPSPLPIQPIQLPDPQPQLQPNQPAPDGPQRLEAAGEEAPWREKEDAPVMQNTWNNSIFQEPSDDVEWIEDASGVWMIDDTLSFSDSE